MTLTARYFIVPGLGNSGPQHWQTWMETTQPGFARIQQQEWDAPVCSEWIRTINEVVSAQDESKIILIGHSLGCASIIHWAQRYGRRIKGALLVAPSDVDAPHYDFPAKGFSPMPLARINFPSIVVASANDQWVSMERARFFAENWGSRLVDAGEAGHINAASGHYAWTHGLELLRELD